MPYIADREPLFHLPYAELMGGGFIPPREPDEPKKIHRLSRLARSAALRGEPLDTKGERKLLRPTWAPETIAIVSIRRSIGASEITSLEVQSATDPNNMLHVERLGGSEGGVARLLSRAALTDMEDIEAYFSLRPGSPTAEEIDEVASSAQEFYDQFRRF